MVRRYEEPVEVRLVPAAGHEHRGAAAPPNPRPDAFVWRGRLYVVRAVLAQWRERRAWWRDAVEEQTRQDGPGTRSATAVQQVAGQLVLEQQVWRVEASPGRLHGTGVFDLAFEDAPGGSGTGVTPGDWRLVRVAD